MEVLILSEFLRSIFAPTKPAAPPVRPSRAVLDVITPGTLHIAPRDIDIGEQLGRVYLITNYPTSVGTVWLSRLANMPGTVFSLHAEPADSTKLVERMNKSIAELRSRLVNGGDALTLIRAEQQLNDAEDLLRRIDLESETVFNISVSLLILANDRDELNDRAHRALGVIAGSGMQARPFSFRQEECYLHNAPYGMRQPDVSALARRNLPTLSLAAGMPFISSGLNDTRGTLLGRDSASGIVLLDMWTRDPVKLPDRTNSNFTVLGAPGTGKSTAVKHLLLSEWAQGARVTAVDPEREYKDLCEQVGGIWIDVGGGDPSSGRINPLQVRVDAHDEDDDDENTTAPGRAGSHLALHIRTLRTFFRLALEGVGNDELSVLEQTLEGLYRNHGVTWETDAAMISAADFPTMTHLYEHIMRLYDEATDGQYKTMYERLLMRLYPACRGADRDLWDGVTNIDTRGNSFVVYDTHALNEADERTKRTQYYNIATHIWGGVQAVRAHGERIICAYDEAHLLIDPEVPEALRHLRSMSKRIRKYGGGLAIITHGVVDMLDPAVKRYGQSLMDDPCFKLLMGADGANLREMTALYDLTQAEVDLLAARKRGHGLLLAGNKRIHVEVQLADGELAYFGKGGGW